MIIIEPVDPYAGTVFVSSNVPETDYPASSLTKVYVPGDRVMDTVAHKNYESKTGSISAAVAISIAATATVTLTAHGLSIGSAFSFVTTGALPAPVVAGTTYYVLAGSFTANVFTFSTTPGGTAVNTASGSQSGVHTMKYNLLGFGAALTNTTHWLDLGATERWKMLDQYNNTQTTSANSIVLQLRPVGVIGGLYLGNIDSNSVTVTVTDDVEGVVYTETQSQVVSNSDSSFFKWFFNRLRYKTYFVTVTLPPYNSPLITVTITKTGSTAKCGVCVLGPITDIGLSQYGLSSEIKDYSTTNFNFDGTSSTVLRNFAKKISVDLELSNDLIDGVQERLAALRQKPVVWLGTTLYGSSMAYGRYSSFKNVIAYFDTSKMSLQIDGVV